MHTYILIFLLSLARGCRVPRHLSLWRGRAADAPPRGINPEMYLCLGIIHIQMHDNDSQINPWQEPLPPAVCRGGEGNLLLSRWPLPRQRPHFTANTLMPADTWVVFSFFFLPPSGLSCRKPVRQRTGNARPTFVLVLATRILDSALNSLVLAASVPNMLQ